MVLGRRLHRQVRRLLAFEDAIGILGCPTVSVDLIRPIVEEAPLGDIYARGKGCGQSVPCSQVNDKIALTECGRASRHDQAPIRRTREAGNATLDLTCIADVHRCQLHSQGRCHSLSGSEQAKPRRDRGVAEYGRSSKIGSDLFEQLKPFCAHAVLVKGESGRIAAWSCQARDKTSTDRVYDTQEYNWDSAGRFQQWSDGGSTVGEYDVGHQRDQFHRGSLPRLRIVAPARINPDIAALCPPGFLKSLSEHRNPCLYYRVAFGKRYQYADAPHALGLLRTRSERPSCRRAAEKRDELSPLHSITSSARASSAGGTVSPSAFAAFKLIRSSNLDGC